MKPAGKGADAFWERVERVEWTRFSEGFDGFVDASLATSRSPSDLVALFLKECL